MDALDAEVQEDADRQSRRWRRLAFGAVALLVVVAGLLLVPLPATFRRPWLAPLLDALYVPALAAVTIGLWFVYQTATRAAWPPDWRRWTGTRPTELCCFPCGATGGPGGESVIR